MTEIELKAIIADASNMLLDEIQGGMEPVDGAINSNIQLIDVLAVLVHYNKLLVEARNDIKKEKRGTQ